MKKRLGHKRTRHGKTAALSAALLMSLPIMAHASVGGEDQGRMKQSFSEAAMMSPANAFRERAADEGDMARLNKPGGDKDASATAQLGGADTPPAPTGAGAAPGNEGTGAGGAGAEGTAGPRGAGEDGTRGAHDGAGGAPAGGGRVPGVY